MAVSSARKVWSGIGFAGRLLAVITPLAMLGGCEVGTVRVASGLTKPLYVASPPGDKQRLFIVEQAGQIKILRLSSGAISTFLDITSLVNSASNERGLLGLAFHPDYSTNRKFYVNYTLPGSGNSVIVEYLASSGNADVADTSTARTLLTIPQPQANHNGGWMAFGPQDDYLYIGSGDGGGSNDSDTGHTPGIGNAQDITANLLGKLLRIDVDGDDFPGDSTRNYAIPPDNPFVGVEGDDEIWAYGLRNPWRCSFDRSTGDLFIGDVGQGVREEINRQPASSSGGENYGWRLREGKIATPNAVGGDPPPGAVDPIYDYVHGAATFQGRSVTGGYMYRGPVRELQGQYFFGDYVSQQVWSLTFNAQGTPTVKDWTATFRPNAGTINKVASFGEDDNANLYIVDHDGEIFRIVEKNPLESGDKTGLAAQPPATPNLRKTTQPATRQPAAPARRTLRK